MKLKDVQAFIPGWNIIYMTREYLRGNREIKAQMNAMDALHERGQQDLALAKQYAAQRDIAKEAGDLNTARDFDLKISAMALSYLK
jgi:hypothetical protein